MGLEDTLSDLTLAVQGFRRRRLARWLKGVVMFHRSYILFFGLISLCASGAHVFAQTTPGTVSKSFDFRDGALGWQGGFADYPPGTDKDGFYELRSEIRPLPSELNASGTGFFIQGNNHSDDLFMFLKRRLDSTDGIVAGQTYQITFTITFASNAQSGCPGIGGSPGDSVALGAGASSAEPQALQTSSTSPFDFAWLRINIPRGVAISGTGSIANGQACNPSSSPYVSVQRTHQHTSPVNANARGELWLIVGTDSGFEGRTALYYQQINVTLVPVAQPPPVLLSYQDYRLVDTGRATALDSVNLLPEPLSVISDHNFSSDHRTRINLFAYNLELRTGEDKGAITVEAEDADHQVYQLPVEAVTEVPNFNWITQVTVKLTDELQGRGDLAFRVKLRGLASNTKSISIN